MRYRLILFLVFGAVLTGLGEWNLRHGRSGFAAGLDQRWLDFCIANARDKISDPAVTLVTVDDEYKPAIGDSLSQADYAAIFGFVSKFEPKTVAFEPNPVFDESLAINQTTLELLKEGSRALPPMTLGAVAENGQAPQNPNEEPKFPSIGPVEGDLSQVTPVTRVIAAPHPQLTGHGSAGFTAIELAGDSAESPRRGRTIPLVAKQGDQVVASFVVQALAGHAGVPLDQVSLKLPPAVPSGILSIGDRHQIPVDARGRMKLYEHSGIGPGFYPSISAFNLALTGEEDETIKKLLGSLEKDFESLRSNLVVIGHDRSENRREALSTSPRALSRAELLTRAIAIVQSGRYIEWWPLWVRLANCALIAVLALFIFRQSRRRVVIWGLIGAFLWFGISMVVFQSTLSWAPPFAPLSLFLLMLVIGLILPEPRKGKLAAEAASQGE